MAKYLVLLSPQAQSEVRDIMESRMSDPSKVKKDRQTECLLWRGAVAGGNGFRPGEYSTMKFKSRCDLFKPFQAGGHIVQLFLKTGEVPKNKNEGVSHLCHKKLCLNPSHLYLEPLKSNVNRKCCKSQNGRKRECRDETHTPQCFSEPPLNENKVRWPHMISVLFS